MAYGFYGFDFSQNPLYSRLFNKDVINKGQQAYTQGMSQFTPYDARTAQPQQQAAPVAPAAPTPSMPSENFYNTQNALFALLADGANAVRNVDRIRELQQNLANMTVEMQRGAKKV